MKRIQIYSLLAIIIIVLSVVGVNVMRGGVSESSDNRESITIGVSAPLTGDLSFLGESYKNAIELAVAEIPSDSKYKYKVIFEDDSFDATKGVSVARKFISVDRVDAMFSFGSVVGNAINNVTEENKVVNINSIASDPRVAEGGWNFVHWTPPYKETTLFVDELEKRNIKKVVLFEQKQPGVLAVTESLREKLSQKKIAIVAEESFDDKTKDFRSLVTKIKNVEADLVILEATSPSLEVLAQQIRSQGIHTPFTSIETFEFTDKPSLFEGAWYVNAADPSAEFVNLYRKKYNADPKVGAGNGYDSFKIMFSLYEKYGNDKNIIREKLLELNNYKGVMGNLSVDSNGMLVSDAVVRIIRNGKPETIK